MKTFFFAILQVICASAILYGYYHLMLRNKRFHLYNRFYLLAAVIISLLVPFLNVPVYLEESEIHSSVVLQTLHTISFPQHENATIDTVRELPSHTMVFNWSALVYFLYIAAIATFLFRIAFSLWRLRQIIKNNPTEDLNGVRFVNTIEPGTPYSFFRWLFWNRQIELRSEPGEQIFRHELFHIQQHHSLDVLFMEFVSAICWVNPFFHLIKKEQKAIHEFLADDFAVNKTDKWEYAELLLMHALNTQQPLVNPFFHNQIKRRIAMITNPQKTSRRYLRKILVLPVAAIVVTLFAFKFKDKHPDAAVRANKLLTIVVDPGHGGFDHGAVSADKRYTESQLNLELSKKIQSLAAEYNVKVIMTRQDDQLPGDANSIQQGLKNRVDIANSANPTAFVSIHMGSSIGQTGNPSGFEAYVSGKGSANNKQNLASSILGEIETIYKTRTNARSVPDAGVYVLDKTACPAVLLECGYMTDGNDLSFVSDPSNQEKIARAVLSGLVKYSNNVLGIAERNSNEVYAGSRFSDSTHPLIVIDGKISHGLKVADLDKQISPNDIQSINVLKDSAAISKYGRAGAYGVVEITTKKSKIHQEWNITGSDSVLFDTASPLLTFLDGKQIPGVTILEAGKIMESKNVVTANYYMQGCAPAKFGAAGKNGVIELFTSKSPEGQKAIKRYNIVEKHSPDEVVSGDSKIFEKVEIEPAFPGGEAEWTKYLKKNLDATVAERNNAPSGVYTVYVQFVVEKDGSIFSIKPLTNHGFGMEQEAMRLISKGPKWVPGLQNGQKVNCYQKQRVDFTIDKSAN